MSTGEEIRLARLFDGGERRRRGDRSRPLQRAPARASRTSRRSSTGWRGADAILISPGTAGHVASVFRHRGAPAMMVRLNWGTQYATQWGYHESRSVPMISAAEAIALGADIVLVGMSIKTGSEAVDAENVEMVARCVAEKRAAGVPIVGEVYPAGHEDISPEERHEVISIGCRIVAELGVDLVKTFYTGERFAEIVRSTPVPILALGCEEAAPRAWTRSPSPPAPSAPGPAASSSAATSSRPATPRRFLQALRDVVKAGVDPVEAAERYGIG